MGSNITKIELVYAVDQTVSLSNDDIFQFWLSDIKTVIYNAANGNMRKVKYSNDVKLNILKRVDCKYQDEGSEHSPHTLFKDIIHYGICYLNIFFDDGSVDVIHVDFGPDGKYSDNKYQHLRIDTDGNLRITIDESLEGE